MASSSSSSASSTSPLDMAMSAASTKVFFLTAGLEMSPSALMASRGRGNFDMALRASAICLSKFGLSLYSGSVLMYCSSAAISEPSSTPSALDIIIIAISSRMSSVAFLAGALPMNFPSSPMCASVV